VDTWTAENVDLLLTAAYLLLDWLKVGVAALWIIIGMRIYSDFFPSGAHLGNRFGRD
jgi:hypothetical protein